ncbi:MAG: coenzyme F420-0:L-glutamate ligase [Chromatiales bacterium]|jgi:coenzyme F420-0:L-glutamate ligase / coenzyme F420-1:gamma-L-glutamate ligase|nr:coenzyme F420-0:L-glutamate ligase [Chromatiales bacterium]
MRSENKQLTITALHGLPRVQPEDDIIGMMVDSTRAHGVQPGPGDILVVAQKIVSRTQDRFRALADVVPSPEAERVATECDKDPRLVQLILDESVAVVRCGPGVLIVQHRLGHCMANAGIDRSNVAGDDDQVLLLPLDPDGWCREAHGAMSAAFGVAVGVVMSDSFGRPWRLGTTGVAIGAAGMPALLDVRGREDLDGRELEVTQIGLGDEVAAAASLLMGQAGEGIPAVWVQGLPESGDSGAASLLRPPELDLFRNL